MKDTSRAPELLCADLDGTLLTSNKKITPRTIQAVRRFHESGGYVAISTGRALINVKDLLSREGLLADTDFIIAYNGAIVYDAKRSVMIEHHTIPSGVCDGVIREAARLHVHAHTYLDDVILCPSYAMDDADMRRYLSFISMKVEAVDDVKKALARHGQEPCLILAMDAFGEPVPQEPALTVRLACLSGRVRETFQGAVTPVSSGKGMLDILPGGCSKATGCRAVRKYLDLAREQEIAVGDADNDISMLREAGLAVCMANGSQGAQEAAHLITEKDNDEEGFARFLEDHIKRRKPGLS